MRRSWVSLTPIQNIHPPPKRRCPPPAAAVSSRFFRAVSSISLARLRCSHVPPSTAPPPKSSTRQKPPLPPPCRPNPPQKKTKLRKPRNLRKTRKLSNHSPHPYLLCRLSPKKPPRSLNPPPKPSPRLHPHPLGQPTPPTNSLPLICSKNQKKKPARPTRRMNSKTTNSESSKPSLILTSRSARGTSPEDPPLRATNSTLPRAFVWNASSILSATSPGR